MSAVQGGGNNEAKVAIKALRTACALRRRQRDELRVLNAVEQGQFDDAVHTLGGMATMAIVEAVLTIRDAGIDFAPHLTPSEFESRR